VLTCFFVSSASLSWLLAIAVAGALPLACGGTSDGGGDGDGSSGTSMGGNSSGGQSSRGGSAVGGAGESGQGSEGRYHGRRVEGRNRKRRLPERRFDQWRLWERWLPEWRRREWRITKRWHRRDGKRWCRYGGRWRGEHGTSRLRSPKDRVSSCGARVPRDASAARRGHLLRRMRADRGVRLHGGGGLSARGILHVPSLSDALRAVPLRLAHDADKNDQIASYDGERKPT
jgi:hypothetical protein